MRRLVVLLPLAVPSIARADGPIEIGLALGGHTFSSSSELGVQDQMVEPGLKSGAAVAGRGAFMFSERLAAEGEFVVIPTKDTMLGDAAAVFALRAHARVDLATGLLEGRLRPFIVGGVGFHAIKATSPAMTNDVDLAFHWGLGVRYAMTPDVDIRIDARDLIVPSRSHNGATNDLEITAGVAYRFGAVTSMRIVQAPASEPAPPAPTPVPVAPPAPGVEHPVIPEVAGIGFEIDSATIDHASAPILDRAYQILYSHPTMVVEISGHTSADGGFQSNLELSQRRADAVKAYLLSRGINDARVVAVGQGSNLPIADNTSDAGRRRNRRIEFRVIHP